MNADDLRVAKLERELHRVRLELELSKDRERKHIDLRRNIFGVFNELFTAGGNEQQYAILITALHTIITFDEIVLMNHDAELDS